MPGHRILVVDDDPTVSNVVVRYLEHADFEVVHAADGHGGLEAATTQRPDLVVLDLLLPGIDGIEICRRLRETSAVPVIMLTALGEETDRIAGLEVGADDYLTKPFSPRELVLRVQSVLRRAAAPAATAAQRVLCDGDLVVDTAAHEVRLADAVVSLTSREYELLEFLLAHPREAFGRAELLQRVWGWSFGDQSTVTVHVRRLREKLEDDPSAPRRITTVWGVGYRYEPLAAQ